MLVVLAALASPAVAQEAPCPSVWPAPDAVDVPIDTLIMALCSTPSTGGLQLSKDSEIVWEGSATAYNDPGELQADSVYSLISDPERPASTFTTGTSRTEPVTEAPSVVSVQTNTFGGFGAAPFLSMLVRHSGPVDNAAVICLYEAETDTRLVCRAADGNRALASQVAIGALPPSEYCFELAWHDARGVEGPHSAPMCTQINIPGAPVEDTGCNSTNTNPAWLWFGLGALLIRRRRS
ncbi:MAG: MYXO-CTERM sorting domain-containing protein [Myxococcota bacterium]